MQHLCRSNGLVAVSVTCYCYGKIHSSNVYMSISAHNLNWSLKHSAIFSLSNFVSSNLNYFFRKPHNLDLGCLFIRRFAGEIPVVLCGLI